MKTEKEARGRMAITDKQKAAIAFIERTLGTKYLGGDGHAAWLFIKNNIVEARKAAEDRKLEELRLARENARPAAFHLSGRRVPERDRADAVRDYAQDAHPMGTVDFAMRLPCGNESEI